MFDLTNWYDNLSDENYKKYQDMKENIRAVLTGTGETKDTTSDDVNRVLNELFGTNLSQVRNNWENMYFFRVLSEGRTFGRIFRFF